MSKTKLGDLERVRLVFSFNHADTAPRSNLQELTARGPRDNIDSDGVLRVARVEDAVGYGDRQLYSS